MTSTVMMLCAGCEQELSADNECLNAECPEAQIKATAGATETKVKATTKAASVLPRRQWSSSGRVD